MEPAGVSNAKVERHAAARGVLVSAGRHRHPAEPADRFLRLSFAAAHPDWIEGCAAELVGVIQPDAARRG